MDLTEQQNSQLTILVLRSENLKLQKEKLELQITMVELHQKAFLKDLGLKEGDTVKKIGEKWVVVFKKEEKTNDN